MLDGVSSILQRLASLCKLYTFGRILWLQEFGGNVCLQLNKHFGTKVPNIMQRGTKEVTGRKQEHRLWRATKMQVILSVLALAAIAAAQTDCPEPVECVVNPCDVERCPRFLNAVCVPNTCDGSCTANFFRGRNNRNNVTDLCSY